mmetsp:Transcript_50135/g.54113  ORF Transcript_50135/g.54113 Transcript_50135/m.54113 type:complete len:314 (-) Transcript_50135:147-1088(-)
MTVDQRDGLVPIHENWRADETPRVWSTEDEKFPGCAFTRSIGSGIAHTLGVTARPEFSEHIISKKDRVLIVASDGINEFMDEATCVAIACSYNNPDDAVKALIHEASECWMSRGDYMDDITAIVVFFDGNEKLTASTCSSNTETCTSDTENDGVLSAVRKEEQHEKEEEEEKVKPLDIAARFWTLFAGATSGFLGGLCGIRGPPVILYFLHPPRPVKFDKQSQRATGAVITATNVTMRVAYYLVETLAMDRDSFFSKNDILLYCCVVVASFGGVLVGGKLFDMMKDSQNNIRMILSVLLLLCGISLLLSSFYF